MGSDASFDRLVYDGGEFGYDALSDDDGELDFLGIPGLLDHDQVAELLRKSRAKRAKLKANDAAAPEADVAHREAQRAAPGAARPGRCAGTTARVRRTA